MNPLNSPTFIEGEKRKVKVTHLPLIGGDAIINEHFGMNEGPNDMSVEVSSYGLHPAFLNLEGTAYPES